MDFRQCTDTLLEKITLDDLAQEMGVSVQSLRQARAKAHSSSYRRPPQGWADAIRALAKNRIKELQKLIDRPDDINIK